MRPLFLLMVLATALALAACSVGAGAPERGSGAGAKPSSPADPTIAERWQAGPDHDQPDVGPCPSEVGGSVEAGDIRLVDVTRAWGLVDPLTGMFPHATAMGDLDGDGRPELFVGTFGDREVDRYRERGAAGPAPDRLLRGGEDGFAVDDRFSIEPGRSSGAVFADLDGDGDPDLVVARNTREASGPGPDGQAVDQRRQQALRAETVVLRNDNGTFTEAARPAPGVGARAVGVLDYDGDGFLDLFVVEDRWRGGSSVLLRNSGDMRFTEETAAAGLASDIHGLSVTTADLTDDGRPDLFVAGSNRMFTNTGGGFEEVPTDTFAWERYGDEDDVAGVAVGDLDGDGWPDLVLGHHYNSTVDDGCMVPIRVYLHQGMEDGQPAFEDVTGAAGIPGFPTKAPHVEIEDFDNDGRPDILATASARDGSYPVVLQNLGPGADGVPAFSGAVGLGDGRYWITGATGDVDGDGRLDVFVADPDPASPSLLLRNETPAGHWLEVQVGAGADGVGTVVEVYRSGEIGKPDALLGRRQILIERGNAGGGLPRAHLGLGDEVQVDVVVRRPGGEVVELRGVKADQRISGS